MLYPDLLTFFVTPLLCFDKLAKFLKGKFNSALPEILCSCLASCEVTPEAYRPQAMHVEANCNIPDTV